MKLKELLFVVISIFILCGCVTEESKNLSSNDCDTNIWPPITGLNDSLAIGLSDSLVYRSGIPQDFPLKSVGDEKLSANGMFLPDSNNFKVVGGKYLTEVLNFKKLADFGTWTFLYNDSTKKEILTYGGCLTNGELLIPLVYFNKPKRDYYIENYFEAIDFGKDYILVKLDSTKNHKLCVLNNGENYFVTCGFIGTKISTQGKIIERKRDGWFCDSLKVAE